MRVPFHELGRQLDKKLLPVYLLSGDEPLQMNEAADLVRSRARAAGYTDREVMEAARGFDWGELLGAANSLSLFAEKRILDLRIPSGKPGADGGRALAEYAARPPADTLLLITLPKLERGQTTSKWFKSLDQAGAVVQVWPVEGARLGPWIEQRMRSAGLIPGPGVVEMLVERVEGNLLAARQEIEKLLLLDGPGTVTAERLAQVVADSARYDVYGLVDCALGGDLARCVRMLNGLRAEGVPAPVVLWALTRETRLLCSLARAVERGLPPRQAVAARREVWEKRKPLVARGLQHQSGAGWQRLLRLCGQADRAIKGQDPGDPWLLLQDITTGMAGLKAGD
ncbi:MAG TPA: DNA polymerase III subunit delta [Sedimenticola sp.]|nr:DNA polymerase III subunit delta [Sedimenticola sp.]